jgi:AAA+ superfamily predicted ATPase
MIYNYQKEAYQKLFRTAIAHKLAISKGLPVQPRFHRLVVGPSGCGKTHLARRVGEVMNWRVLTLNMAGWIVLGARETPTWHYIGEWLSESEPGVPQMIILDEIDKVTGEDSWTRYLRAEVYSLVDGLVPPQVMPNHITADTFRDAIKQTIIFGCGAFQTAFESKATAGFISTETTPNSSNDLAKHLQRELVNRFNSDIVILPDLKAEDYQRMVDDIIPDLPEDIGDKVKELAKKTIPQAVIDKTGARFIENIVSDAYVETVDVVIGIYEKLEKMEEEMKKQEQESKEVLKEEEVENLSDEVIEGLWNDFDPQ